MRNLRMERTVLSLYGGKGFIMYQWVFVEAVTGLDWMGVHLSFVLLLPLYLMVDCIAMVFGVTVYCSCFL
jgi:hypothetical protein